MAWARIVLIHVLDKEILQNQESLNFKFEAIFFFRLLYCKVLLIQENQQKLGLGFPNKNNQNIGSKTVKLENLSKHGC